VRAHHLSPNDSELRAGHSLLGLVNISNLLAEVELAAVLIVDAIQGEEGGVVVSVGETSVNKSEERNILEPSHRIVNTIQSKLYLL